MEASMAAVEPLPLLPATCTMRRRRCGLPRWASKARMCSSFKSAARGVRCSKLMRPYHQARASSGDSEGDAAREWSIGASQEPPSPPRQQGTPLLARRAGNAKTLPSTVSTLDRHADLFEQFFAFLLQEIGEVGQWLTFRQRFGQTGHETR